MICLKKIIAVLASIALAAGTVSFASPQRGERVTVIVEVNGDAVLEAENAQKMGFKLFSKTDEAADIERDIRLTQAEVQSDIRKKVDSGAEIGYTYTHVFNGFSMEVYENDIEKIEALPDVESVYRSRTYTMFDDVDTNGEMYIENGSMMMNADYMHDRGYTGKGTVIAIVDDGFDPNHENFQGAIQGAKLSRDDIADKIDNDALSINSLGGNASVSRVYRSEKIPYAFNYYNKNSDTYDPECDHGQHVAGIAAGNNGTDPNGGKFVGAAPDAQLLLMSIGYGGKIDSIAEIAAIEDAIKLGADVINASYGEANMEIYEPQGKAINAAVKAGVLFSASAGNSSRIGIGAEPLADNVDYSSAGTPAVFSASTAVASANNTNIWTTYYNLTAGSETMRFTEKNNRVKFSSEFSSGEYEYMYAEDDFENIDATGKIVMINNDNITIGKMFTNIKKTGAVGLVIINTDDTIIFDSEILKLMMELFDMPTAVVSRSDGEIMKNAGVKKLIADSTPKTGIISGDDVKISFFSSWGTNSSLELKPEITTPGGYIYSSIYNNKYGNKSGTSMAAPHMTGVTALLCQYINEHGEKYGTNVHKPSLVENVVMSSADVIMQDSESDIPYSPRLQGAGMVNLEKAAKTPVTLLGDTYTIDGTEYEKSKLSLKEIGDTFELAFKARNFSDTDVAYDNVKVTVITDSAGADGYVGDMKKLKINAEIPESVTVPAKGETNIKIPVTLDKTELDENMKTFVNGFFIDGYVFLNNSENSEIPGISMPFTGFYGDWCSAPALDKTYFSGESILKQTYMYTNSKRQYNGEYSDKSQPYIMGTNWFATVNEENKENYENEAYVGYSPNGDGEADNPTAMIVPIRKLGRTDFSIYDTAGKELLTKTVMDGSDYFYCEKQNMMSMQFDFNELNALPDGDYIFKVKTGFYRLSPYEQREKEEFKFYLDRVKPEITKYEKSEDGKTLTIAATDNRHLMGFVVSGKKNDEPYYRSYPIAALTEYETDIDITGIDEGTLAVEAVDYAQNSAKKTDAGLDIAFSGTSGSSYVFTINNTTGDKIGAAVTMAMYRGGQLIEVHSKNEDIPEGTSLETFNADHVSYDEIKIFVWDSLQSMAPLYKAFKF